MAMKGGITRLLFRPFKIFQSGASCNKPEKDVFIFFVILVPAFTNLIFCSLFAITLCDARKSFKWFKIINITESWRKVNRPWSSATLHPPRTWAVVQMVLLHKKLDLSADILQRCKFEGDGKVSYVAPW